MNASLVNRSNSLPPRPMLTLVEARLPTDPFLLTHFEQFYREIVGLKGGLNQHSGDHVSLQAIVVHDKLLSLLMKQEEQVSHTATLLGAEMYRQAQRVMACMADEIFLQVHWPPGTSWRSLEEELFEAAEMKGLAPDGPCMKKLDLLLRQDDPAYRELGAVYFYALSLNKKDDPAREQYLQPLAQMIFAETKGTAENDRIFAQPYAHTLTENRIALLPPVGRWWLTLGGIVLLWLAVSCLLWQQLSSPIVDMLQRIQHTLN